MSSDRELLLLAAKAANMAIEFVEDDSDGWFFVPRVFPPNNRRHDDKLQGTIWNPLTDNGDALLLAVKMNMQLGSNADSDLEGASWAESQNGINYHSEPHTGNPAAATRRVIVKCAAETGRTTP